MRVRRVVAIIGLSAVALFGARDVVLGYQRAPAPEPSGTPTQSGQPGEAWLPPARPGSTAAAATPMTSATPTTSATAGAAGSVDRGRVARPPLPDLYAAAAARATTATSVQVTGEIHTKEGTVHLDVAGATTNDNYRQVVHLSDGALELLTVGPSSWGRELPPGGASASAEPYRPVSPDTALFLPGQVKDLVSSHGPLEPRGLSCVDVTEQGRPAWLLRRTSPEAELAIAADGSAELLRLTTAKMGTLTFARWNQVPPFAAPSPAQLERSPG